MRVSEILSPEHVSVANADGGMVRDKPEALRRLAVLLTNGQKTVDADEIERILIDREKLQSTGLGGGVAIPHGVSDKVSRRIGAMLLCPSAIAFDAIDGAPVSILVALVGPKRDIGEHLKMLARVSRLLRDERFRARLLAAPDGRAAFDMIAAEESRVLPP